MKILLTASNTCTDPYPVYPLGMSVIAQALAAAVQSQLDQSRGRLEQFGSEVELSAKKQALTQKLDLLNERREALTLARQTLEQANAALAERFSPRLVREASDIFSELTGGRADQPPDGHGGRTAGRSYAPFALPERRNSG